MIISDIQEREDGTVVATVTDAEGTVVGYITYTEDSLPRPVLGEIVEGGIIRRFWRWVTS